MKKIPLTRGKFALVDDEDYGRLSEHKWYFHHSGYAIRKITVSKKQVIVHMHREVLMPPIELFTDHINGNGLDNRRENLRNCTAIENSRNQSMAKSNKSGFKGVSWHKAGCKWRSVIHNQGKQEHLGEFFCIVKAAKAYDEAARKYHGDFARTNF